LQRAKQNELRIVPGSSSRQLTRLLRGVAARHPRATAAVRGWVGRHPKLKRAAKTLIGGLWRTAPRSFAVHALPVSAIPPHEALRRGTGRRAMSFGHVLPYPIRAGNEYRFYRLLRWLAEQNWDLLLVICPFELPPPKQLALAAAVFPRLIVLDRSGAVYHNLGDEPGLLDSLRLDQGRDIKQLLGEDDTNPEHARILGLQRAFCPDELVEVLLRLDSAYRPELLLSQYIFQTRAFAEFRPETIKVVDTVDVFSSRASKIERYGTTDGLAMSEAEEASLLRRAELLIAIQPNEADDLARLAPDQRVVSVGVDFPVCSAPVAAATGQTVLLIASGNPINVKGLQDFLADCWPLVAHKAPAAELVVGGAVCDAVRQPPERVTLLGRVGDVENLYAQARVLINPAIAGVGLKIKTVEAICHFRTIVCWPSGVDGVPPEALAHCRVATDWGTFAEHIITVLTDDGVASAPIRDRELLEFVFSPDTVYAPLREALDAGEPA
jgi:hypothetical protein